MIYPRDFIQHLFTMKSTIEFVYKKAISNDLSFRTYRTPVMKCAVFSDMILSRYQIFANCYLLTYVDIYIFMYQKYTL